ncbi:MAG: hypothetical protein J5892_04275 [Bacilli bacterium]|nr:hypothetical protein [Bacilli bacterium]
MEKKVLSKTELFYDYLKSQGFNPNDYAKILELFQPANNSMSQYLTKYDQYLLSKKVVYSELDNMGINGANGYLDQWGNIFVPKSIANDARFLHSQVLIPYKRHIYDVPTINDFDVIIGHDMNCKEHIQEILYATARHPNMSQFFGKCVDIENAKDMYNSWLKLVNYINDGFGEEIYSFEYDTKDDKAYCLIKKGN